MAGSVMSVSALMTGLLLSAAGGVRYGSGAIISLALIGPMMDAALRRVQSGPRVYVALALAGVAANLLALTSRATTKILGLDIGSRPFDSWWLLALGTYTASGIVAGLFGAICWFHFRRRDGQRSPA
jgi:membrane associated rhomboid family serine protease